MKSFFLTLALCFGMWSLHGQDTLVKTDHSRLAVKVIEVNPGTIKYKRFDYPDGPLIILDKKEVLEIVYRNGWREVMTQETVAPAPEPDTLITSSLYDLPYQKPEPKLKISFNAALVVNGSYSNKPYRNSPESPGHSPSSQSYARPGKEQYDAGFSLGFTLLSGRNEYFKKLIGIQYVQSKAEFNRHLSSIDVSKSSPYATYSTRTELNYKNTSHFINLVAGFHIKVFRGFSLEPCLSLNMNAYSKSTVNGLITQKNGPDPTTYHSVQDSTSGFTEAHVALSFMPKAVYEFQIREQKLGVYVSYNMALKYRLPWWMFGVTWYPFKSLR